MFGEFHRKRLVNGDPIETQGDSPLVQLSLADYAKADSC